MPLSGQEGDESHEGRRDVDDCSHLEDVFRERCDGPKTHTRNGWVLRCIYQDGLASERGGLRHFRVLQRIVELMGRVKATGLEFKAE